MSNTSSVKLLGSFAEHAAALPAAHDARPIGVFDSGLGGLTVARSIAATLPHESIYYVGDTKRCPYGVRTEDEVRAFALEAGRWLEAHDVKILSLIHI